MKKRLFKSLLLLSTILYTSFFCAQGKRELTINDIISLVLQNHQQIKVSKEKIDISKQEVEIAKLQQLPTVTASTNQFYLGNVNLLDKKFSSVTTLKMPHYGSSYAIQANQLIFKGGVLKKSVEIASLKEQLSELDYENDKQNIKFLVISNYLDFYKLINQIRVYENNRKLAIERLKNTQAFYQQGMVTRNEVIRGQLTIKNLDQGLLVLENNRKILNYNLNTALGILLDTEIIPVENIDNRRNDSDLGHYQELAHSNSPVLKSAQTRIKMTEKNIEIIKTDKIPAIAAFGGYTLQRPLTNPNPVDYYSGGWQAGVSLSYNIDNLYKTKENLKLGKLQKMQAESAYILNEQNVNMGINAAYLEYINAIENARIQDEAQKLANENYKITEAKYLHQLAVQAEMIDAQNQKLQAELEYTNAEVNILYQYYNLLKSTGTL